MKHIIAIVISVLSLCRHGKTVDFEKYSPYYRTTVAHFLGRGKWNDTKLEDILKTSVIQFIYKEALLSGKLSSALWMIPFLPKQSLRHGLCTRLKMCISTSPTSKGNRITGTRLWLSCSPATAMS